MRSFVLLMLLASAATAADQCRRDSDCGTGKTCIANRCTASREEEAAVGAGMALQYTKNTWPMSIVDRPLVVAPGMTEASLGFNKDLTADLGITNQPHPLGMAATARFGVSDRIHAGLDILTLCLTDCEPTGAFSTLSVGAGYAVVANRDMNFVPALTMSINNVPTFSATSGLGSTIALAISPGFLFGYRVNQAFQLFATGGFIFPLTARDDTPDLLGVHVEPRFQLAPRFSIAPYVGYQLSLKDTSFYLVPVGVNLLIIADRAFDVGAGFELNDVSARRAGSTWSDFRSFNIFGTIRL